MTKAEMKAKYNEWEEETFNKTMRLTEINGVFRKIEKEKLKSGKREICIEECYNWFVDNGYCKEAYRIIVEYFSLSGSIDAFEDFSSKINFSGERR